MRVTDGDVILRTPFIWYGTCPVSTGRMRRAYRDETLDEKCGAMDAGVLTATGDGGRVRIGFLMGRSFTDKSNISATVALLAHWGVTAEPLRSA